MDDDTPQASNENQKSSGIIAACSIGMLFLILVAIVLTPFILAVIWVTSQLP
jgi:hypothetical protein